MCLGACVWIHVYFRAAPPVCRALAVSQRFTGAIALKPQNNFVRFSTWVPLGPGEEVAQTAGFLHSWMDSAELVRPARNVRTGMKVKGMMSGQWEPEHRLCYLTTAESRGYSQPCSSITMTQEMNGPHPGPSIALHRRAVPMNAISSRPWLSL